MTKTERAAASKCIADRFVNSRYFLSSNTLACYIAAWDEVETSAIIERAWRANKRIFAPVIESGRTMSFRRLSPDSSVVRNRYGLWEPVSEEIIAAASLDVVVTPVVAFDSERNRVGMGGGYFDTAFAFLSNRQSWRRPKLIGLAFRCQAVRKIAQNPWDIPLSCVITESRQDPVD